MFHKRRKVIKQFRLRSHTITRKGYTCVYQPATPTSSVVVVTVVVVAAVVVDDDDGDDVFDGAIFCSISPMAPATPVETVTIAQGGFYYVCMHHLIIYAKN